MASTGWMVRWLKKSSKETMTRASICIWFCEGSKFDLFSLINIDNVLFCSSGSFFSSNILRWLKIWREIEFETKMIRISSHLNIFELKKWAILATKACDQYFEEKIKGKWMVWIFSHLKIRCICWPYWQPLERIARILCNDKEILDPIISLNNSRRTYFAVRCDWLNSIWRTSMSKLIWVKQIINPVSLKNQEIILPTFSS